MKANAHEDAARLSVAVEPLVMCRCKYFDLSVKNTLTVTVTQSIIATHSTELWSLEMITLNKQDSIGNTLTAAICTAFNVKCRDVKDGQIPGMFEVYQGGAWVSYDWHQDNENYYFYLSA